MRIHLIAVGGSIMHNLALALKKAGHQVSGSDDVIYDPARSRLAKYGLLPEKEGWDESRIVEDLDMIILGMHAKSDNPELKRALNLGLNIMSFPEFVSKQSMSKTRIAVAGSHGKTTTTTMIMHGLNRMGRNFDYLVGAQVEGYELMVKLSDDPIIVIEGDEYLSSALDQRPKFLHYNPQILVLTGLEWDHFNVFPTYESYLSAFERLVSSLSAETTLVYNAYDPKVQDWIKSQELRCQVVPYESATWRWNRGEALVEFEGKTFSFSFPGNHNVINAMGAIAALSAGSPQVAKEHWFESFSDYVMPDKRLNLLVNQPQLRVYRDFAHAPSKVNASVRAIRAMYPDHQVIALLELHTYSSLNMTFLPQYEGTLEDADQALVYYNPHALKIKNMKPLDPLEIKNCFKHPQLHVSIDSSEVLDWIRRNTSFPTIVLVMTSSNFGGVDWLKLGD